MYFSGEEMVAILTEMGWEIKEEKQGRWISVYHNSMEKYSVNVYIPYKDGEAYVYTYWEPKGWDVITELFNALLKTRLKEMLLCGIPIV